MLIPIPIPIPNGVGIGIGIGTPVKNLYDFQSDFSATKSKLKSIDNFDYC